MSNIKPINISLDLLKIPNKKNKTIKTSSNTIIKPNILRKELLARIKSHRNNKLKESIGHTGPNGITTKLPIKIENKNKINKIENDRDADDFSQSIDFLKSLSKKKQNNLTQKTNFPLEKTIQSPAPVISVVPSEITSEHPSILNKTSAPVYGCLKNGSLPTFREFKNKTFKKPYEDSNISLTINEAITTPMINPIIIQSDQSDQSDQSNQSNQSNESDESKLTLVNDLVPVNIDDFGSYKVTAPVQEKCLTKPKTIKYTLGKKDNIVSVLIKNAHTRKNIVDSIARVKETKITDMKKYLKQHNLLKSGSKCPPDIIKKIYEQSFLCGIIKNNNKDNLIENFLNN